MGPAPDAGVHSAPFARSERSTLKTSSPASAYIRDGLEGSTATRSTEANGRPSERSCHEEPWSNDTKTPLDEPATSAGPTEMMWNALSLASLPSARSKCAPASSEYMNPPDTAATTRRVPVRTTELTASNSWRGSPATWPSFVHV